MPLLNPGLSPGLTINVINKLKKEKIKSVQDFIQCSVDTLAKVCHLSLKDVFIIRTHLFSNYAVFPVNGADYLDNIISTQSILKTGCPGVDTLLGQGIYTNEILEIFGAPASGKTQFALSVSHHIACVHQRCVLYIDNTGGFSCSRILEICKANEDNQTDKSLNEFQQNVRHSYVYDVFHLFSILHCLTKDVKMQKDRFHYKLKLVVIDSIATLFAPILGETPMHVLGLMVQLVYQLKQLCSDCNLAILIVNHLVQNVDKQQRKCALGNYWQHVSNAQLLIENTNETPIRKLTLTKSSRKAAAQSVMIKITSNGIESADSN